MTWKSSECKRHVQVSIPQHDSADSDGYRNRDKTPYIASKSITIETVTLDTVAHKIQLQRVMDMMHWCTSMVTNWTLKTLKLASRSIRTWHASKLKGVWLSYGWRKHTALVRRSLCNRNCQALTISRVLRPLPCLPAWWADELHGDAKFCLQIKNSIITFLKGAVNTLGSRKNHDIQDALLP